LGVDPVIYGQSSQSTASASLGLAGYCSQTDDGVASQLLARGE
jgi:hypothetical protein